MISHKVFDLAGIRRNYEAHGESKVKRLSANQLLWKMHTNVATLNEVFCNTLLSYRIIVYKNIQA